MGLLGGTGGLRGGRRGGPFGRSPVLIDAVRPPSCSEAALRILGLSLAGWNALIAAALAALALRSALARGDRFA